MKLKLLKFFIIAFLIIFAVLNGRFFYTNVRFALFGPNASGITAGGTAAIQGPENARLIIKKIGVGAPIVLGADNNSKSIPDSLEKGVVNYPGSPKPGEGLSIILGHSSAYPWYKGSYGSVFALIGKLKPGDKFSVEYGDGRKFIYSVKKSLVFSPFAKDAGLSELEKEAGNSVILISCWPLGTNYKRIAVLGKAM